MTASANLQGRHGGQKSLFSEAKRRAEQLFESSTVAEIREVRVYAQQQCYSRGEAARTSRDRSSGSGHRAGLQIESKTRADIEAKKNQLRQLVGDSYRSAVGAGAPGSARG